MSSNFFFCHRDLHLNLEMSATWPCCISRTLPPPRCRNTRCGLPGTSSNNQTPFQGSLKVNACEVYLLIYVDQLERSKDCCNNAPVHLYQGIQSIGVAQQEVFTKKRKSFKRSRSTKHSELQHGILCLGKRVSHVNRTKHSELQAWLQTSSSLIAKLCLSSGTCEAPQPSLA